MGIVLVFMIISNSSIGSSFIASGLRQIWCRRVMGRSHRELVPVAESGPVTSRFSDRQRKLSTSSTCGQPSGWPARDPAMSRPPDHLMPGWPRVTSDPAQPHNPVAIKLLPILLLMVWRMCCSLTILYKKKVSVLCVGCHFHSDWAPYATDTQPLLIRSAQNKKEYLSLLNPRN